MSPWHFEHVTHAEHHHQAVGLLSKILTIRLQDLCDEAIVLVLPGHCGLVGLYVCLAATSDVSYLDCVGKQKVLVSEPGLYVC